MLKKKSLLSVMLCSILALSLFAGCSGGEQTPASESSKNNTAAQSSEAKPAETEPAAESTNTLVIYNSNTDDWSAPIVKEFQEQTGIKVELVGGNTGELHARVKAEAENPLGDILWGGTPDSYMLMGDYLFPYVSTETENIRPELVEEGGTFHHITMDPYVIMYNTNLVSKEEAPTKWADLLDPKWKGKIALSDPSKSASTYVNLSIIVEQMNGDFTLIEQLIDNLDGKLANGSAAQIKSLADGEYAIGCTYEEAVLKYVKNGANMEVVFPEEGTQVSSGCFAIVKGGQNTENAKKFIDFALSKEVQSQLPQYSRRPVRSDVAVDDMPDLGDIGTFDTKAAAENKDAFMQGWQDYWTK